MNESVEELERASRAMNGEEVYGRTVDWRVPGTVTVCMVLAIIALFWRTGLSMVSIWWRSETYAHGFIIAPIAIYLVWRKRHELAQAVPQPDWRGIVVLAALGSVWLVANMTDVLVVQQLCFVAMIPTAVWTILGWGVVRVILFPLGFLILSVPMGQALIPHLMNFTAGFVVKALRLTGIPVYQQETFFSIPGLNWSVVEGCSGMRYLIASVTMGFLYAYLSYRGMWRRVAFIALATVFPIIANGLRAYTIVLIAYWIDKRLALGVDHIIYGWFFFGLVMVIMFWIGTLWLEGEPNSEEPAGQGAVPAKAAGPGAAIAAYAIGGLLVVGVWPFLGSYAAAREAGRDHAVIHLTAPRGVDGWHRMSERMTRWSPRYLGQDAQVQAAYAHAGQEVGLYLAYYARQRQGRELINYDNVMVKQKDPVWDEVSHKTIRVTIGGRAVNVIQSRLHSARQDLLVWHFYWLHGYLTSNDYRAKLLEAEARLLGRREDGAGVVVYTTYGDGSGKSKQLLQEYLNAMFGTIGRHLRDARAG